MLGISLLREWLIGDTTVVEPLLATARELAQAAASLPPLSVQEITVDEFYAANATTYDNAANPLIAIEDPVVQAVLPPGSGQLALDAACGTGRHAAHLAARGYSVVGVDASPAMLEVARQRVPHADFRLGTLEALPVASASIDTAVCGLALTLCVDIAAPIAELARVIKPGGTIVISDLHPLVVLLGGHMLVTLPEGEHGFVRQYVHAHADYFAAFTYAGLVVQECREPVWPAPVPRTLADVPESAVLVRESLRRGDIIGHAAAGVPGALVWVVRRT